MVWKNHYQQRLFDITTVLYAYTDALPEDGIGEEAARIRYTGPITSCYFPPFGPHDKDHQPPSRATFIKNGNCTRKD
jgi:hypothetical protein